MSDISTKYLGLELENPIIIASGPLTGDLEHLKACQEAGAGAVVLKSIFEEQIESRIESDMAANEQYLGHSDAALWFESMSRQHYLERCLDLIRSAKKELSIPVIASINCARSSSWIDFIPSFEEAGADAIELNYHPIAADAATSGSSVDDEAVRFARSVRAVAKGPVSMKIGCEYSSLANIMKRLDGEGIDGLVLFNRFFRPDIDIESMGATLAASPLSSEGEYAESLRWSALMSAELKCSIAATTGIHTGDTVIKFLLAGAAACQVCSAAIRKLSVIGEMKERLCGWMAGKGFSSLGDFQGRLAQERMADGSAWERVQYVRSLMGEV